MIQMADERPTIRVAIVDAHLGMHQMLDVFLASAPEMTVVGTALDGRTGLRVVRASQPDVLILDVRLHGRPSGLDLAAQVRTSQPAVAILGLCAQHDLFAYQELLRLGAPGYERRDAPRERLIETIRLLAIGQSVRVIEATAAARAACLATLSKRAYPILVGVASGQTNVAIGLALCVSSKTIEAELSHLMVVLDARNRAELVAKAYECGLLVPGSCVADEHERGVMSARRSHQDR
jgi:DNA-binding NarL/FixJ family response regulator